MKEYTVLVPITGYVEVVVEAEKWTRSYRYGYGRWRY